MVNIEAITYEESRLLYFQEQKKKAERSAEYWAKSSSSDRHGWIYAWDRLSEAVAKVAYYSDVIKILEGETDENT